MELERDLDKAQHEYVTSKPVVTSKDTDSNATTGTNMRDSDDTDSSGSNTNKSPSTLSERTLAKRHQKEAMMEIANEIAIVQEELASIVTENEGNEIHKRNANRLLQLCRTNAGVYIKVGQHLANLDLLLPEEYIQTLSSLFDDAPVSSYDHVCEVVKEELGSSPEELFDNFSREPIASASLAQVHTATCKESGRKLAIKVQHKGLRETSKGDLFAMATVVGVAERLFDNFNNFGWICEELTPQLPKELDFNNEGKNAEAAAAHLEQAKLDCVVPSVLWSFTNDRVLTMEFEEGFKSTDVESIEKAGICRR